MNLSKSAASSALNVLASKPRSQSRLRNLRECADSDLISKIPPLTSRRAETLRKSKPTRKFKNLWTLENLKANSRRSELPV